MYNEFGDGIWEPFLRAAVIKNNLNETKGYPFEKEVNGIILPKYYDWRTRKII